MNRRSWGAVQAFRSASPGPFWGRGGTAGRGRDRVRPSGRRTSLGDRGDGREVEGGGHDQRCLD